MFHGWGGAWTPGGYGYGFPWGGLTMGILVLAAVAIAVFLAARAGRSRAGSGGTAAERGLDILIERFARGEIDADAFRAMKAEIERKG